MNAENDKMFGEIETFTLLMNESNYDAEVARIKSSRYSSAWFWVKDIFLFLLRTEKKHFIELVSCYWYLQVTILK